MFFGKRGKMKYYFAPLEGITGYRFRQAHHQFFPGMDAYFTPFVVATYTKKLKSREKRDILPENNAGVPTVPQILTAHADEFLFCARYLADFGYPEINLNLGCPVGTVTAKGKGSGMLRSPEEMDRFLDAVYEGAENIPVTGEDGAVHPIRISVKTRLGWENPAEFERLLEIYERYPLSELIVHARTRQELYLGRPELAAFSMAFHREQKRCSSPEEISAGREQPCSRTYFGREADAHRLTLCYNGDVRTEADLAFLEKTFPGLDRVMIGRGLLSDPNLVTRLVTGRESDKKTFREFHDTLYAAYDEQFHDDRIRINCMKELWTFLGESFCDTGRYVKGIHKAGNRAEYEAAVRMLFANCELQPLKDGLPHSENG